MHDVRKKAVDEDDADGEWTRSDGPENTVSVCCSHEYIEAGLRYDVRTDMRCGPDSEHYIGASRCDGVDWMVG